MNTYQKLTELLSTDLRFVSDTGQLLKNKIVEQAFMLDSDLIKLLLSDDAVKKHFFTDVEGVLIFDKVKFQHFVNNKEFLPGSYTSFKNKIGLTTGQSEYLSVSNEVVLAWPYKDCVLEGGQDKEDAKRQEVFYNETLAPDEIDRLTAPKVLTGFKKYASDGGSVPEQITDQDNFIIKGNNLLALHTLKKSYAGKVKLIYIDPPYNTGSDSFGYNDSFNRSTWLTFMRNRLEVAKDLLHRSGTMMFHIDEKEMAHLRVLCDEVLGRENFLNIFCIKTSDPSGHKTVNPSPYSQTEYILLYARHKPSYKYEAYFVPSNYDGGYNKLILNPDAPYTEWEIVGLNEYIAQENGYKNTRQANQSLGSYVFESLVAKFALENRSAVFQATAIANDAAKSIVAIRDKSKADPGKVFRVESNNGEVFVLNGRQVYFYANKVKEIDGQLTPAKPLTNLWADIAYNGISKEGGVTLKNGKKPEKLLRRVIDISTNEGDLVLDYHLGSGTTAAVAHKMKRRYIGIEQLDYGKNDSTVRLNNVIKGDQTGISKDVDWHGGGSFIYCELKKSNQAFIDLIQDAKTTGALMEIWSDMKAYAFLSYQVSPKSIDEHANDFSDLSLDDQKRFLIEVLDKNMLYVPYSEIDDETYAISDQDKALNKQFFGGK